MTARAEGAASAAGTAGAAGAAPDRLVEVGERLERVLEGGAPESPVAREDARELVRLLTDLYGEVLERVLSLADDAGSLSDDLLARLADDRLVGSLLLVHGLHPYSVQERVERALAALRLERHSAEAVATMSDDGMVRVSVAASGCGSGAVVDMVRAAVEEAAPDADVHVEAEAAQSGAPAFIPLETLMPKRAAVRT
ncbi:hypothetical protein ABH920_006146 [Catenulispora sp. EB89]|uniref:NifU family protein n=1 Tax=Catenulispora sp. EB89 TaxID=3156257 RepID=UPI003519109F